MNCLDNLIGINNACSAVAPTSGRYIQDLPGITIKIADAAVTEEGVSGETLIKRKIKSSQDYIVNDIKTFLNGKFNFSSLLENKVAGFYKKDQSFSSIEAGKLKGFKIEVDRGDYLQLNIHRIGIKLTSTIDTYVFVYDLYSGNLLDTVPFSSVSGEIVYVNLNKNYQTERQNLSLFICYDSSLSGAYNSTAYDSGAPCRSCGGRKYYSNVQSGYINVSDQKIGPNFNVSSTSNGLTVDYSVSCSLEPFICSLSSLLSYALLFRVGADLMMELKCSRRLNSIVTIDASTNEVMYDYFQTEYEKAMRNITSGMRIPDDICFKCDSRVRKQIQIP
jgi:hypothetical protein